MCSDVQWENTRQIKFEHHMQMVIQPKENVYCKETNQIKDIIRIQIQFQINRSHKKFNNLYIVFVGLKIHSDSTWSDTSELV